MKKFAFRAITAGILSAVLLFTVSATAAAETETVSDDLPSTKVVPLEALQDNNIPLLTINIDENADGYGTIEEMNNSKVHTVNCTGTIQIDVPDGYKGDFSEEILSDTSELKLDYIRGRGNFTWLGDKKPYKFKLDKSTDLLGMGKNKHWVLLANRYDATLLKNRLVSYIGRELGLDFTPKMLPVDVVMNGEYIGSYCLAEQVRVGKTRVNIDELTPDDNDEPEITGGYLMSLRPYFNEPEENIFLTERGNPFLFVDPEFAADENGAAGTSAQKEYITHYLQRVEDAVFSDDFTDEYGVPISELMDLQSTADYWWVQSFTYNADGYRTPSTYLYKERDGKLKWGPLWDFDLSSLGAANGFVFVRHTWLDRLRAYYTEYQQMLFERWKKLDQIITDIVKPDGIIDQYAAEIRNSQQDDFDRWGKESTFVSSIADYTVENLRQFYIDRQKWINENIQDELTWVYCTVQFMVDGKVTDTIETVRDEPIEYTKKAPEKDGYYFVGWQLEDGTNIQEIPITDDTVCYAKYVPEDEVTKATDIFFMYDEVMVWKMSDASNFIPQYSTVPHDAMMKDVEWFSSDSSVAEIDEYGSIILKAAGEATITAILNGTVEKSFQIKIVEIPEIPEQEIKGISFEKDVLDLTVNEYAQNPIRIVPYNIPEWLIFTSFDEEVATVDDYGVVHAIGEGTAVIEVRDFLGTIAQYTVTVTKPSQDESSQDEPSQDEPSQDEPSQDEPSQDESSQDEPSQDEPSRDEPSQDEPSQDELSQDEPSQDEPSQDELSRDEPSQDEPSQSSNTNHDSSTIPTGDNNYLLGIVIILFLSLGMMIVFKSPKKN